MTACETGRAGFGVFAALRKASSFAALLLAAALWLAPSPSGAVDAGRPIPAPVLDEPSVFGPMEVAVLAGGCFWGVQAVFQHVKGVTKSVSGYAGGDKASANYEAVSSGRTDHAEVVQVTFDPTQISYGRILQIYFSVAHDPTQLNRQGPDTGTQYRSDIFTANATQAKIANAYIAQLNQAGVFDSKIVTKVSQLDAFYPAEKYHQNFLFENPTHPYIVINDLPKIEDLRRLLPAVYRAEPVLVK